MNNNLWRFEYPESFLGTEPGAEERSWPDAALRIVVVGASSYKDLAGNMAVPLIHRMILEHNHNWAVERAFFPGSRRDMEILQKWRVPIFSLETKHSLAEFDVICMSCSVQMGDLNLLKMLQMSYIPLRTADRGNEWPLIIRGGQNDSNPTPVMPFYDIFYVGEAEIALLKLLDIIKQQKDFLPERAADWKNAVKGIALGMEGTLVPEAYEPEYGGARFKQWNIKSDWIRKNPPLPVRAARIKDLANDKPPIDITVNYCDRMGSGEVLLSRGCTAWCNFCNEGSKERPYREVPPENVVDLVSARMKASGASEVTLSAFCVSSYRAKKEVYYELLEKVSPRVKLTSQRVDESSRDYPFMRLSAMGGNKSVSFGMEGISDKLRRVVNKHCTEGQLLKATENAIKAGYNKIKYFLISNIPTETEEDQKEFIAFVDKVIAVKQKYPAKKVQMLFSWTDLVMTPHTPFQWLCPSIGKRTLAWIIEEMQKRKSMVGFTFGVGKTVATFFITHLLNLGDTRIAPVLEDLIDRDVVYFGSYSRKAQEMVEELCAKHGVDPEWYIRERDYEETLPWEIISYGIRKKHLWQRLQLALKARETPKCTDRCMKCGLECGLEWNYREVEDRPPNVKRIEWDGRHGLLLCRIESDHRFLDGDAVSRLLRRALYKEDAKFDWGPGGINTTKGSFDWREREGGLFLADVKLSPGGSVVGMENSHCQAFTIIDSRDTGVVTAPNLIASILVMTEIKIGKARQVIERNLKASVTWEIKADAGGRRAVERVLKVKDEVKEARVRLTPKGVMLTIIHAPRFPARLFYAKLAKTNMREAQQVSVERVGFLYDPGKLAVEECPKGHTLYKEVIGKTWCWCE